MKDIKKLILTLVALLAVTTGAYAASVSYVDGNGTSQTVDATELESTTTSWTDGSWYIVPEGGLTISGRIAVSGTVNLILRDGTELTASAGITTTNATLNIYAQSTGTGALTATGANGADYTGGNAGIGGIGVGGYASGGAGGTVNIYGGTVTATGGNGGLGGGGGAGIGGGGAGWFSKEGGGAGGTVNIYGGTVTATGGTGGDCGGGGAGIGGGGLGMQSEKGSGAGGTVNIYGGTVTATSGTGGSNGGVGAGIGGGGNGLQSSADADGTLTLGVGVKLYNGTDNTGTVLDDSDSGSRNYSGSRPQNMYAEGTVVPSASTGPEVDGPTIVDGKPQWTFTMPGGNVTLEPDYYPQATAAEGAVTAADADARATTDDPLVKVDATKLTGAKKLMYFVSNSGTTAPAYDAEGWTDQLPTAEGFTQQGIVYVWYYPVGTDEGVDGATATYSDGDICATALTVTIGAAPTYAVTFAEGVNPEPPAEPEWTASPAAGVTKGQTVTVTYTGSKKVIGVKAEKKAATKTLAEATLEDIGKIAGADGNIYDSKADAEAANTTAVAMIAYVGTASDCAHGLAIALADESDKKNYGAAGTACSGKAAVTGGTWRLPSIKDWQYMLIGCGASESYKDNPGAMGYSGLASKLTTAQGNALVQGVSYWSSTGNSADYSWRMYINGSNVNFTLDYKGNDLQVRACFAF